MTMIFFWRKPLLRIRNNYSYSYASSEPQLLDWIRFFDFRFACLHLYASSLCIS